MWSFLDHPLDQAALHIWTWAVHANVNGPHWVLEHLMKQKLDLDKIKELSSTNLHKPANGWPKINHNRSMCCSCHKGTAHDWPSRATSRWISAVTLSLPNSFPLWAYHSSVVLCAMTLFICERTSWTPSEGLKQLALPWITITAIPDAIGI